MGGGGDDTSLAEDGADVNAAESDAEALTSTLIAGGGPGGSVGLASAGHLGGADLSGAAIGDGAKALYFPRTCLTVAVEETVPNVEGVATYTFAGCTGPNGLLNVTGVVKATYRASRDRLTLDLVGEGLRVNRAHVDWSSHAEIVAGGNGRTMTWSASLDGTTARGRAFSRNNQKVVTWTLGEPCLGLDGASEGDVAGRSLRTEITAFRRCRGSCPDAGGRIVVTDVDAGRRIEIRYDGTNRATIVGPSGRESTFQLACR